MSRKIKTTIYNVYHKPSHIIENEVIRPIAVGSASIPGIKLNDSSGENISHLNSSYCELTAQYWAAHNDLDSDYIGFFHYRRYLCLSAPAKEISTKPQGHRILPGFYFDFDRDMGFNAESAQRFIAGFDIIVPSFWDVKRSGFRNNLHQYGCSPYHQEKDLDLALQVMLKKFPDYSHAVEAFKKGHLLLTGNMFIMRADLFRQYAKWIFEVLAATSTMLTLDGRCPQSKRAPGYLSERLFTIWFLHHQTQLKVRYAERVFIEDTQPRSFSLPPKKPNALTVTIASDDNYVPHLAALIQSVVENFRDKTRSLEIIILDGGINDRNKKNLRFNFKSEIFSLIFFDMKYAFSGYATHSHFTKASFFRLKLASILADRDKALYLDCDTIVLGNIAELFDLELDRKPIAAVPDYIMLSFCLNDVIPLHGTGAKTAKAYLSENLGMASAWDQYFQAGLLMLDLKRIRELNIETSMTDFLKNNTLWFLDQDVLNKFFVGQVKFLPLEWNFPNCDRGLFKALPAQKQHEINLASENHQMIHYAGYDTKPWVNPAADLGEFYFFYLRKTLWGMETNTGKSKTTGPASKLKYPFKILLIKLWRLLPVELKMPLNRFRVHFKKILN
jgi:lipopolysaccharide biosynthesis glycosyltransferase